MCYHVTVSTHAGSPRAGAFGLPHSGRCCTNGRIWHVSPCGDSGHICPAGASAHERIGPHRAPRIVVSYLPTTQADSVQALSYLQALCVSWRFCRGRVCVAHMVEHCLPTRQQPTDHVVSLSSTHGRLSTIRRIGIRTYVPSHLYTSYLSLSCAHMHDDFFLSFFLFLLFPPCFSRLKFDHHCPYGSCTTHYTFFHFCFRRLMHIETTTRVAGS